MEPFLDTPVRQLSLGQRMRGEVTAALLHSPELLVLDEPTIGLDLMSKERLRGFLVRDRQERGTTVLLTTHDLPDIERLCDRILVIDHGRVAFDGTLPGLVTRVGAERVLVVDLAEPGPPLTGIPGTSLRTVEADGMRQHLSFRPEETTAAAVVAAVSARVELRDLAVDRAGHRGRRPPPLRRLTGTRPTGRYGEGRRSPGIVSRRRRPVGVRAAATPAVPAVSTGGASGRRRLVLAGEGEGLPRRPRPRRRPARSGRAAARRTGSSRRATSSISRWIVRRSGRAPSTGS